MGGKLPRSKVLAGKYDGNRQEFMLENLYI
jgi:hypothetical protein